MVHSMRSVRFRNIDFLFLDDPAIVVRRKIYERKVVILRDLHDLNSNILNKTMRGHYRSPPGETSVQKRKKAR
jgi:glucose-6-phosphate 1-dehydrogenase